MRKICFTVLACMAFADPAAAQIKLGSVDFKRCELGTGLMRMKAGCATIQVPENYAQDAAGSNTKRIDLHVALLSSRAKKPLPDPVVFLAGGPGQAGSDSVAQIRSAFEQILKTRHVIVVDQRGTGKSGKLACKFDEEAQQTLEESQDQAQIASYMRSAAQQCRSQLEARPGKPDLSQYTTGNAVEDLETLRKALAAPQLNVLGISYGTRLAQQFAKRYPNSTRSLILDGLAPNDLALGAEHARVLDEALSKILARCTADKACKARFGDSEENLRALRSAWISPSELAIVNPRTGQSLDASLSRSSLQGVARMYAYSSEFAAMLPLLLHEALNGRPQALLAQSHMVGEDLSESISYGMQLSVVCAEDADRFVADPADKDRLMGDLFAMVYSAQCTEWPKGQRAADFTEPLRGNVPTLLVSGEFDPVTPASYGDRVLKNLSNAIHIVVAKQGHVNVTRGCLPKLTNTFLQTLEPKKLDQSCVKKILPAPFFLDYTGAAP
jgi:pimeloyl-ACP methyl ester carboxylesterase